MHDLWHRGIKGVLLIAVASITLACSATTSKLRARFAKERGCPDGQVAVSSEGGAVYRASGCGQDTEYICETFAGMGDSSPGCRERGLNPREPSGNPPPREPRADQVSPR